MLLEMFRETRAQYLSECWKHAKYNQWAALLSILLIVYSVAQSASPLIEGADAWNRHIGQLPKLPLPWALAIYLSICLLVVIEGGYRLMQSRAVPGIPTLVIGFPKTVTADLFHWLEVKNIGPGSALDIQIQSIERGPYRATFEAIHVLEEGDSTPVGVVTMVRKHPNGQHEFHHVLSRKMNGLFWDMVDHGATPQTERTETPVTITFFDRTRTSKHQTVEIVVCDPVASTLEARSALNPFPAVSSIS